MSLFSFINSAIRSMSSEFFKSVFILLFITCYMAGCSLDAKNPIEALSEFQAAAYIDYETGNFPLIISVPHGGTLRPSAIADRNCPNAVNVTDEFTIELAEAIIAEFAKEGYRPYIVINKLHRSKMDANRNRNEATCGDSNAQKVLDLFHEKITSSHTAVSSQFQKGLYLDLHGHGNSKQRVELGYLLYENELALPPETINSSSILNVSSIQNLAKNNLNTASHYDLLSGEYALGTLLESNGFNSVPSTNDAIPLVSDNYFSGGYNTVTYSSYSGGTIDGIQVECNRTNLRETSVDRELFAKAFTKSILTYITQHYFEEIPIQN